jgi:hypothetical protein
MQFFENYSFKYRKPNYERQITVISFQSSFILVTLATLSAAAPIFFGGGGGKEQ